MAFEPLGTLHGASITLPVPGGDNVVREYVIASPDAEYGLWLTEVAQAATTGDEAAQARVLVRDDVEDDQYRRLLGDAYEPMLADRVSAAWFRHVAITVTIWTIADQDAAERYWSTAGDPSLLAPNRAARRAASSGSARSTRKRGSTSGTNRPPATAPAVPSTA